MENFDREQFDGYYDSYAILEKIVEKLENDNAEAEKKRESMYREKTLALEKAMAELKKENNKNTNILQRFMSCRTAASVVQNDGNELQYDPSNFLGIFDYFMNRKHKRTQIEEFCVTINPGKNKGMCDFSLHNLLEKTMHNWVTHKCRKHNDFEYMLTAEYTQAGCIHWHGVITCNEECNMYKHVADLKQRLGKIFGLTKGKPVYNSQNYIKYMSKDHGKMPYSPLYRYKPDNQMTSSFLKLKTIPPKN